jgi:hypothetical protein
MKSENLFLNTFIEALLVLTLYIEFFLSGYDGIEAVMALVNETDFQKSNIRIYHSTENSSGIILPVLK